MEHICPKELAKAEPSTPLCLDWHVKSISDGAPGCDVRFCLCSIRLSNYKPTRRKSWPGGATRETPSPLTIPGTSPTARLFSATSVITAKSSFI